MSKELKLLEDILKRNSDNPDEIDINNEVNHYFFFDEIKNTKDLNTAWSVFKEHKEIQKRLSLVEDKTNTIPGWGYRTPQSDKISIEENELINIVTQHVNSIHPMLPDEEYFSDLITFIKNGFTVEIAPSNIDPPDISDNELFFQLYEAIGEYWIECFPRDKDHYEVLNNWAIYLTKCDEVAIYLMWPCLEHEITLSSSTMDAAAKLWKLGCRDRYWIKDLDYSQKVIYVKPPS